MHSPIFLNFVSDLINEMEIERLNKEGKHANDYEFAVFQVWGAKVLQNNKAIYSSTLPNAPMYEITYNGDKEETYVDVYHKKLNYKIDKEGTAHVTTVE